MTIRVSTVGLESVLGLKDEQNCDEEAEVEGDVNIAVEKHGLDEILELASVSIGYLVIERVDGGGG